MAKTILGIDIGHDQLKLALVKGKRVLRVATADMPENLLRENHQKCGNAADDGGPAGIQPAL